MSDPRLDSSHLDVARQDQYEATINEMLDDRGPVTSDADPLARLPRLVHEPSTSAQGGTFFLISLASGCQFNLRMGINAIGRSRKNDLILRDAWISRRHCAIMVHATGKCEVYDTASRNGTMVNEDHIGRAELRPGDILKICHVAFMVAWAGQNGQVLPEVLSGGVAGNYRQPLGTSSTDSFA
jgi:pSer/pThr/pTyr-binding forkhead associated (FHA) protein